MKGQGEMIARITTGKFLIGISIFMAAFFSCTFLSSNKDLSLLLSNLFPLIGSLAAIYFSYYAFKNVSRSEKTIFLLMIFSLLSSSIGVMIRFVYLLIQKKDLSYPGIEDFFFLFANALMIAEIAAIMYSQSHIYKSIRHLLDVLMSMIVFIVFSLHFIILPLIYKSHFSLPALVVGVAYPSLEIGIILGVLLLAGGTQYFAANEFYPLLIGLAIYSVPDWVTMFGSANAAPISNFQFDLISTFSVLLMSLFPINHVNNTRRESQGSRRLYRSIALHFNKLLLFLPYILFVILYSVVIFNSEDLNILQIGITIVIFLFICRQIFVILENKHLINLLNQSNTELQELNHIRKREAETDFLTGLYNRRYIDVIFNNISERSMEHQDDLLYSLFILDVDHFKRVNDQFGHKSGDLILQQIAEVMKLSLRAGEIIGRFGGEEFVAILQGIGMEDAVNIADRLRTQVANYKFSVEADCIHVTVSIGVSMLDRTETDAVTKWIKRADQALYEAKNNGRNKVIQK